MKNSLLLTGIAASAILSSVAGAQSIGVDFLGGASDGTKTGAGAGNPSSLDSNDQTPPGLTAGVVPQNNWNDVAGSTVAGVALHDSTGAASGITLSFASGGNVTYSTGTAAPGTDPNAAGDTRLMNGYIDGLDNQTNTYTFSNVPAGTYDLINYSLPDSLDGRTSHYSVYSGAASGTPFETFYLKSDGGANFNTNGFVQATSTTAGAYSSGNYTEFLNVSPSGGVITLTGTSDTFRNYSNGIQLIPVAVPEPSTWLAAGGLLLLAAGDVRRRLRR